MRIIFIFLIFSCLSFCDKKILKFHYTDTPIKLDGELTEWEKENFAEIKVEDEIFGFFSGKWDKNYIYLAFKIYDKSPMKNSGEEPNICFKYGDTVEFFICTDKNYKFEKNITENHYRILMTYLKNKKVIYCFKYIDKDSKNPLFFFSPAGTVRIDWAGYIEDADMEIKKCYDFYNLEVKIPIKFFRNFEIEKGMKLAGDFAINFSDDSGTINVLKVYWNEEYGGIVNDILTEQKIEPDRWGIFEF